MNLQRSPWDRRQFASGLGVPPLGGKTEPIVQSHDPGTENNSSVPPAKAGSPCQNPRPAAHPAVFSVSRKPASFFACVFSLLWVAVSPACRATGAEPELAKPHFPRLSPDYTGITIPPNIAPLNFKIEEPGRGYRVELRSVRGDPITLSSRSPSVLIPAKAWKTMLRANAGQPLYCAVWVQNESAGWSRFATVTNWIAREEIDGVLVYRLLKPLYNLYVNVGIYQRDLQSFSQQPVLENQQFGGGCLNCHTFLNHRPENFAFHVRSSDELKPMVLARSNQAARVDQVMGYMSWHPSGRLIAFSANKLSLFFHTAGETRDVFDAASDLGIYRVDSNTVASPPSIAQPKRNETWPAWSPDGRYLYYCRAPELPFQRYRQVRYDLVRTSYDLDRDQWGEPEVLLAAKDSGLSAAQPKISPDGRYVLFCLSKYGNFPIYQPGSDLYVMDLNTRQYRRLEINSDQAETWHCWSSNSRWVVFSSKRLDGLFARPFFSYVDEQGQFHKPFVLPQEDPEFYNSYLKTFNVPELVQGPVTISSGRLAQAVLKPKQVLKPKAGASPTAPETPAGQGKDEESPGHPR